MTQLIPEPCHYHETCGGSAIYRVRYSAWHSPGCIYTVDICDSCRAEKATRPGTVDKPDLTLVSVEQIATTRQKPAKPDDEIDRVGAENYDVAADIRQHLGDTDEARTALYLLDRYERAERAYQEIDRTACAGHPYDKLLWLVLDQRRMATRDDYLAALTRNGL